MIVVGSGGSVRRLAGDWANDLRRDWALLSGSGQLALDGFEVDLGPSFGQHAIDKSAALVDFEANFPTGRGYAHEFSRLGRAHAQVCFYDVVSLKLDGVDGNVFVGNGRIDLSPEHFKAFASGREPDGFELVTAGVGGHGGIKPRRVLRDQRLHVAHVVLQKPRLRAVGFQNGPDWRS